MEEFKMAHDIQAEERMTRVNPLSSIPERVMTVRELCVLAFRDAEKAFGSQMGSDFERALRGLGSSDFSVSVEEASHTISTRTSGGALLSLSVDSDSVTLLLAKGGKEDSITYRNGEISRKRQV
jgi:hypothetical protein